MCILSAHNSFHEDAVGTASLPTQTAQSPDARKYTVPSSPPNKTTIRLCITLPHPQQRKPNNPALKNKCTLMQLAASDFVLESRLIQRLAIITFMRMHIYACSRTGWTAVLSTTIGTR